MDQFTFSAEPLEIQVKIGDKEFLLKEADEDAARIWRSAQMKNARVADGKLQANISIYDGQSLLVSMCLFDRGGEAVSINVIRKWPTRIVKKLYMWIRENSDLEEKEDASTLQKERDKIDEKLKALQNGDATKNSPRAMAESSD
jgi:hypothetical protein